MELFNTAIKEKDGEYIVNGRRFSEESSAQRYVEKLDRYNRNYLSFEDPSDGLTKLFDEKLKNVVSIYRQDTLKQYRDIVSSRSPYIDDFDLYASTAGVAWVDKRIIMQAYQILRDEYIEKYGY